MSAGLLAAGGLLLPSPVARAAKRPVCTGKYKDLWAMGGWNRLLIEADSDAAAHAALNAAVASIRGVDVAYSVFDVRSTLSRVNSYHGCSVPIDDPDVLAAIDKSLTLAKQVGGAFDPTVESLMWKWGFRDGLMSAGCNDRPVQRAWDFRMVSCDAENSRVYRDSDQITIDPGGWAKGLAAELSAKAAIDAGASVAQVSCGGDIFRLAANGADTWECAIRDPLGGRTDSAVRVRHRYRTVATSGNFETYRITPEGSRVSHLMDPRTGEPADSDLLSVSVFGDTGLSVDAVSSALFVMGREDSLAWLRVNPGFGAVILDQRWPSDPAGMTVVGELEVVS